MVSRQKSQMYTHTHTHTQEDLTVECPGQKCNAKNVQCSNGANGQQTTMKRWNDGSATIEMPIKMASKQHRKAIIIIIIKQN